MTEDPLPNRRAFLKGQSALDAIQARTTPISDDLPMGAHGSNSPDRQAAYLEQYSSNAMACEFVLSFNMHQYSQAGAGAMAAFELIGELESQLSVYRTDSEISEINRVANQHVTVVEEHLYQLLKLAIQIHNTTNQAFDITAGQLSKLWGFESRNGALPEPQMISEALNQVGSVHLDLNDAERTIQVGKQGVSINLGGIGKGHALDRAGTLLKELEIHDFIIHGGQSSVLASGQSMTAPSCPSPETSSPPSLGWTVGVTHPTLPNVRLAEIYLRDRALGTSGTGRQGFFHQGKRYGHIIDPRTGWPASHFLSTTVLSPSAAISDALATAFFVMKLEEIESYCQSHPDVAAVIVSKNTRLPGQVELQTFNLSDPDWKQL